MFDELENPEISQRTIQGWIQKSRLPFVVGNKFWVINDRDAACNGKDISWLIKDR